MASTNEENRDKHASQVAWFSEDDVMIGAASGAAIGVLAGLVLRKPIGPPAMRFSIVGGCTACVYRPITRGLSDHRGFDDPMHHMLAGGICGYGLGGFATGVERGAQLGGMVGAAAGAGAFFAGIYIDAWRFRRGQEILAEREEKRRARLKEGLLMQRAAGTLSGREYERRLQELEEEAGPPAARAADGAKEPEPWWAPILVFLPLRKVSEEEITQMEKDRERWADARARMPGIPRDSQRERDK